MHLSEAGSEFRVPGFGFRAESYDLSSEPGNHWQKKRIKNHLSCQISKQDRNFLLADDGIRTAELQIPPSTSCVITLSRGFVTKTGGGGIIRCRFP